MSKQPQQLSFSAALSHSWHMNDLKSIKGLIGLQAGVIKALFGRYTVNLASPKTTNIIEAHQNSRFAREALSLIERNVAIQNPDNSNAILKCDDEAQRSPSPRVNPIPASPSPSIVEVEIDPVPEKLVSEVKNNKEVKTISKPITTMSKDDSALLTKRVNSRGESGIYSTEENGLGLFTLKKRMKSVELRVADYLKKQSAIGVMFTDLIYAGDSKGAHYTLGDSAVAIQIVRNLAKLNVPRITLFIEKTDELVLSQLSLLFPFADFSGNPPWSFNFEGSEIEVNLPEKESKVDINFSFRSNKFVESAKSMIVVKPFKFGAQTLYPRNKYFEDINPHVPTASIIPQQENDLAGEGVKKGQLLVFLENAKMVEGVNKEALAENLVHLANNIHEGRINYSLTYGLHHSDVKKPHRIVEDWVEANRLASRDKNRPAVVSVKFGGERFQKDGFKESKLKIIDITDPGFKKKLDNLNADDAVLLEMPALPNPVFRWMVTNSNCPVLVEGANLTSDLLEHGIPYLSVLPDGKTRIPFEFGNPLEAIKQQSLSFRLTLGKDVFENWYANLFRELKKYAGNRNYQDLHEKILERINNHDSALSDLLGGKGVVYGVGKDQFLDEGKYFSILDLIENMANKYGNKGEPVVGPINDFFEVLFEPSSPESYAKYIQDSGNADTETGHHFQMIADALENPLYNSLITAIYHMGVQKGEVEPLFADKQQEWQKALIKKYDEQ